MILKICFYTFYYSIYMDKDYEIIKDNVPDASIETIKESFEKNSHDILKTICDLLEIKEEVKEKTEWEKRREIADTRSHEINKVLKSQMINNPIPSNYEDNIQKHSIEEISENSLSNIVINPNIV
jgi:hypothetical protein